MAKLKAHTAVRHGYDTVVLLAGDEVPEWAVDQVGEHLLAGEVAEPKKTPRNAASK